MADRRQSLIDDMLVRACHIAVLAIFASLFPRLPDSVGYTAVGVLITIACFYVGREFWRGVQDAGGWSGKRVVNHPAPNPDAKSELN